MKNRIAMRMLSVLLCFVMLVGLVPTSVFAAGTKLETPQNLKLQGTVLSWDAVDNADFYGITLYHPNYVYSIGSWQTDGTSINLYKYLKDGETYGATVIACSNGSYQISTPAEIPLTACTNAGVPIYRDVNVVNGTSSASTAYPGMSVRLEAKPAPDGMVFDRWELSGGYINIGYSDTDTTIYVQAICDNDISARATYKYQENVTSAFTVQPQGGAALVGESFDVTYAMNFTPQGTVKVQVEGNTPGDFTDLKQGEIDSASIKEDSVVTKTFRIMAFDGTRNIYSDEFVVSWEDGPRFVSQPMGGTVDHNVDFVATYALNFTPFSCRVERYNDYLGQWSELSFASATQATISSYDFNTSSIYRIKAIIEGGGEVYSDEFTVTWSDAVSKFIQQPVGGIVGLDEDFTFTFAINFTPVSNVAIQKYNSGFDSWDTVGYCTSLTSGTISGFASETTNKYRLEAYENGTPIHSNEFTVTWEGTDYTVTFDSNGGSAVTAQTIEEGQKATKPADPTKDYYAFDGWYSDSNLTQAFDFNTPITGDTTIYAKWDVVITAANATVTVPVAGEHPDFNPISGDSSRYTVAFETWYLHESPYPDLDANSVFEHGKTYSLRIRFTPNAGYQFDSNTVFTVNGKATTSFGGIGAREYSATAYAATYTVTYDANGGTGSMAQEFLTHDNDGFAKNYAFPQCGFTSPAGQEFDKWLWYYESNPGSTNEITPGQSPWIYGNIVVKALWKTAEYNVTVTGGTASVGAGTPITKATMGTTVTLIAGQAPAGQEFDKWVVNGVVVADANSATTTFVMPAGNVTATATYKNIPVVTYTVTFDANGGTGTMAAANGISGNYTLPPNGFTPPANKQFKCWSVNDTEKNPFETISVTENVTVKAVWKDIAITSYTVSFDSNGGSGSMASVTNAPSLYTLPANGFTPPANKQFKCWAVGAQNDEYDPGDKITITANVTVKAVWEAITSSRQVISDVVATSSDLDTIPTLYGLLKMPTFNITQGAPAYINASTSNLRWQKKVGGVWTNQDSGRFTPGEWRITSSLRIDGTDGYYYELGNPTTLKVNGVEWTVENGGKPSVHPDYSHANILSPVFTIVDDPNVQPPVSVPSVHMVLKGYEKGALISAASVQTDAMVDADVLGFLKLVDSNGDGVPEPEVAGNNDVFEEGVLYAVAISLHAKDGYDISGLTPATVSLDRSLMDSVEEFVEDDETFSGIYLLDDINQWTVKFETNGGSSIAPKKVSNGKTVTPPADPTRAYYAFAGWYSDSNLTQAFDFNTPITGDITLYAKWTPSPVGGMFLMTIDFNGGTSTMPSSGEVPVGSEVYFETGETIQSVVTPPSGKVFDAYEIDGVRYEHGDEYYVTQNFTLKFLWKDAPVTTYTVSFNANGGTGTMADVTGITGEYTLPANGFTAPDGKQFKAWSVGGVEKAVGDKITVTADTTVTAVWETIPAGHTCDIKPAQKVEPSCTEGGKEAYYKCEGCGKFYEDALGAKEITDLAAWGNLEKLGHTESGWKSDKDNHWKECTVAGCGVIIENSKAAHADANNDGKCDVCEYNVGTANKPSDDVQSPQTGDNSMMWLWVALLFVSGFGVVATTVYGKRRTARK